MHHVVFLFVMLFLSVFLLSLLKLHMEVLRVGYLNINGGRDMHKRALVSEIIEQKKLHVIYLQETHSDVGNEVEWGLWWKGQYKLSHKTNLSAGVAIFFSPDLRVTVLSTEEPINGRLLVVKADIDEEMYYFINVYAPNVGFERLMFFGVLSNVLKNCFNDGNVIVGGGLELYRKFYSLSKY